jgi:hypothetical protein
MLALLASTGSAFLLQVPSRTNNAASRSVEIRMRAPDEEFDRLFVKGGEAIADGDMGKALAFFQRALQVDPTNEQTKAMVAKLSSLGIAPADISEDDPSGQDAAAR